MLSRFFGKGNRTPPGDKTPDAPETRGLEVVEDDPDTAWDKWAVAVAEQESCYAATERQELAPELDLSEATVPAPLPPGMDPAQAERERRKEAAMAVVDLHHQRIGHTIRTMWGYKECSVYINKLIMAGGDGMGNARVGFHQEAVEAMMVLVDLHDSEFGAPQERGGLGLAP